MPSRVGDDSGVVFGLLTALAGTGAADHLVTVATALHSRGHRVSVATEASALEQFRHLDVELHPMPEPPVPELLQSLPPVLQRVQQLLGRVRRNVIHPLPQQAAVVRRTIRRAQVQVVISDPLFLGASLLDLLCRTERPAIMALAPEFPTPCGEC